MRDRKILVTSPLLPDFEEYCEELKEIWERKWLTNMGAKHEQFRAKLREYLGVPYLDLLTNGHMALELSLAALKLKGEVITTPFTFVSTTHAIVRNNLTPVFCDVNQDDFTMDVTKIEDLITEDTCAIMPVHVYGNVCNIEEIERIAKKYNLKVIYDAAHAFGETYKGKSVAAYGDVSCFSFHATKVFNSIEGGLACFEDPAMEEEMLLQKNFGIKGDVIPEVGANAKMNEFCAAMGLCNLRHLEEAIQKRKAIIETYRSRLEGVDGISLNPIREEVESNYAYFPIVIDPERFGMNRDELMQKLADENIMARKYFYPLTSECLAYPQSWKKNETPVAKWLSENVLTLPLYADLEIDTVNEICDIILR